MRCCATGVLAMALWGCAGKGDDGSDHWETGRGNTEDADGDGYLASADCDDGDADSYPGADEVCDGVDNDCDGLIDEGVREAFYADADRDGYGDPDDGTEACSAPPDHVDNAEDCDDGDAGIHPGADELCDEVDNDCDGDIDEEGGDEPRYADEDGDGYGDPDVSEAGCGGSGWGVDNAEDCDDADPDVFPGAEERCNGEDDDCDGDPDEDEIDWDDDGYDVCADQDCDDRDPLVGPDGDTDGDGEGDCYDDDDDGDGLDDADEEAGTTTGFETDPLDADTDGDGVEDGDDPAPATAACTSELLFFDDFDDEPTEGGWVEVSGTWTGRGGRYTNDDQVEGATTWLPDEGPWDDAVFEVRLRADDEDVGDGNVGVMTRAVSASAVLDGGEHYYVGLNPSYDEVVMGAIDGAWHHVEYASVTLDADKWYVLQVQHSGVYAAVYLGEELLFTASDATFSEGSLGLRTYLDTASYDYALVCR